MNKSKSGKNDNVSNNDNNINNINNDNNINNNRYDSQPEFHTISNYPKSGGQRSFKQSQSFHEPKNLGARVTLSETKTFSEKAREHWTPERIKKVTSGKKYPILPSEGAELLRALGLLNADASMSADAVRKYIQINHMLLLLEPYFLELCERFPTVRVLDAGCGSSFLTFLLAWCFRNRWKKSAHILGVDSNEKLIQKSRTTAQELGLSDVLKFECANLQEFLWDTTYTKCFEAEAKRPNAVVALHACDTATDIALAIGIAQKADFLGVAPCCQAELARKWAKLSGENFTGAFAPVFANPNLRREIAAHLTDTLRMLLMRGVGYEVTITEFVPSQHSPKNRLMTAVRRGNFHKESQVAYTDLKASLGGQSIALEDLLAAGGGSVAIDSPTDATTKPSI